MANSTFNKPTDSKDSKPQSNKSLELKAEDLLAYKSSNTNVPQNTILLDAIDNNDTDRALQIIQLDKTAEKGKSIINKAALFNTPLLLAFKKGNMKVAEAILGHPNVDVMVMDGRGLTAMHWACMLRQDKMIELLLEQKADPQHETPKWVDYGCNYHYELTPISLYQREVLIFNFCNYYQAHEEAQKYHTAKDSFESLCGNGSPYPPTFFKSGNCITSAGFRSYTCQSGFADRNDLNIPGEIAYTDVVFHMADLCTNLNWKNKDTEFRSGGISSHEMFRFNFLAGMAVFCKFRNKIPANKDLVAQMERRKTLQLGR